MKITILCIGKLKEEYWSKALNEYKKRLASYCTFAIEELKEGRLPDAASALEEEIVKVAEGKALLKRIRKESYVIALEVKGISLSSEEFAKKMEKLSIDGKSDFVFLIGGSLGLSLEALDRADYRLSFSKMTFPHQMMRVILAEQIYRSFKIIKNESYHK